MTLSPAPHTRFHRVRSALEAAHLASPAARAVFEFALFGFKQAWACLFGALLLGLLLATHLLWPAHAIITRYDFLFVAALAIQVALLALRLETLREAKLILAFHAVGTLMELFKTSVGSWTYAEPSLLHLGHVPLFSGFMYAAVGSYIARVWRIFDFRFTRYPPLPATIALALAIYANFFTHHFLPDLRIGLFALIVILFARTRVIYTPFRTPRAMPLLIGWFLVATFIWFGENLGTLAHAWTYPHQAHGWAIVPPSKLGAWYLLMIISFVLVSLAHRRELVRTQPLLGRTRRGYLPARNEAAESA